MTCTRPEREHKAAFRMLASVLRQRRADPRERRIPGERVLVAVREHRNVRGPYRHIPGDLACRAGRNRRYSRSASCENALKDAVTCAEGEPVTFGCNKYVGIVDTYNLICLHGRRSIAKVE